VGPGAADGGGADGASNGGGEASPPKVGSEPAAGRRESASAAQPTSESQPARTKAAAEALTDTPPVLPARLQGLDLGPACAACGGMMQRTGSCYTCSSCGNNTGCG
jgi:ribonucleoside-diphosphate reductase alpha chain